MTTAHNGIQAFRISGRAIAIVALLGLLYAQIAVADHQFEHPVSELGEQCDVCLRLDRDDSALVAACPASTCVPVAAPRNAPEADDWQTPAPAEQKQRGPPRV